MSSTTDAFDALDAAVQAVGALDWDAMPIPERLESLDRLETIRRRAAATSLDLVGSVERSREPALGGAVAKVIADVVRISPTEARRRIRDAGQLQHRTTLTGQTLPPALPATAKAWDAGHLDIEHLRTIQKFIKDLPEEIHPAAVEKAEAFLAEKACELRPDQLEKVADLLAQQLNPDGKFSDEYRAAQRGFQSVVRPAAPRRHEHCPARRNAGTARHARSLDREVRRTRHVQPCRRDPHGDG